MSDKAADGHKARPDHLKHRLIESIRATAHRCSGRNYRINLEPLDVASLRALDAMLRAVEQEKDDAVRRMREGGWRR